MSLVCEKLAIELFQEVQSLKLQNPVKDQLRRASLSIALNISEGAGRTSRTDQKRFYSIALGSLRETQTLVKIIGHQKLIKKYDRLGGLVFCLHRA
jgi:four helix bundle protein